MIVKFFARDQAQLRRYAARSEHPFSLSSTPLDTLFLLENSYLRAMMMNIRFKLTPGATAVTLAFLASVSARAETEAQFLKEVTVTGTREAEKIVETPHTVDVISGEKVREQKPSHPAQVMNQVPGVWVSNLSGEGHMTAIRQPLTTSPVYLYLEDGIPIRSTGFFNHNALYEVNVPQSGGMEIMKGPGTALYGSDAIGGTVNVLTRTPPREAEFETSAEIGSYGWGRVMVTGGDSSGDNAWRGSLNLTTNNGYQNHSSYNREAGTFRWDRALDSETTLKTVFAFSTVDQNHVGNLNSSEFRNVPRLNNIDFSYRKVEAFRLSTNYEKDLGSSSISFTPYVRDNWMKIIPSWSVSYDPTKYVTENQSFGFLSKYRQDFEPMRSRLIVGLDFDISPGSRDEDSILLSKSTNAYGGTMYRWNKAVAPVKIYDYDVTFRSISPYVHGEISPTDKLRLTAGLRYDDMQYDYSNNMNGGGAGATRGVLGAFPGNGWYGHVANTTVNYTHWGPKLGATYEFSDVLNGFASYTNSFRTPSEGQVFRGSRQSTANLAQIAAYSQLDLKPVIVDNYELGLRGNVGKANYEVSVYYMKKKDDIVSYQNPVTNERLSVNAGETLHKGIEFGLGAPLATDVRLDASVSYAKHTYEKWDLGNTSYSGNEMESAPRLITNTRATYSPGYMNGGRVQLEWFKLGSYYQNQTNTIKYGGYNLWNLYANYPLEQKGSLEIFGSVRNLFDEKYAETAGVNGSQPSYTSGLPRTFMLGVQKKW